MSLYPITILLPIDAEVDPNVINSGSLVVMPIDMTEVAMTQITLFQMSNTQDFSLRAWLSRKPGGDPVLPTGINSGGNYAVSRYGGFPIVLYVKGETPPDETFPILITPGIYYLNILNLTNETNLFGFSKLDLVDGFCA